MPEFKQRPVVPTNEWMVFVTERSMTPETLSICTLTLAEMLFNVVQ